MTIQGESDHRIRIIGVLASGHAYKVPDIAAAAGVSERHTNRILLKLYGKKITERQENGVKFLHYIPDESYKRNREYFLMVNATAKRSGLDCPVPPSRLA